MKVCVITGAGSGIGRALAVELVGRGDAVVVADIDAAAAERVAGELTAAGRGTAYARTLDVTDRAAVADLAKEVRAEHGRIDIWFNNAGIGVGGFAEELTAEHWDRTLAVNLHGVVHGVEAVYPIMLEQGHGHIVNTASLAGLIPAPMMTPYTATKHAVVGLSTSLRVEAAPHGVRVTAVCPGFVDTPILDNVNPQLPATAAGRAARAQALATQRALLSPERLARTVVRGVERNKAVIVTPAAAKVLVAVNKLAGPVFRRGAQAQVERFRRAVRERGGVRTVVGG